MSKIPNLANIEVSKKMFSLQHHATASRKNIFHHPKFEDARINPINIPTNLTHFTLQVGVEELDTILYVDCTKLGVLNQTTINALGDLTERVLFRAPSRNLASFQVPSIFLNLYGSKSMYGYLTWLSYPPSTRVGVPPMAPGSLDHLLNIEAVCWSSFRRSWLELMRVDHSAETSGTGLGKMHIVIDR